MSYTTKGLIQDMLDALGTPAGTDMAADIAAIKTVVDLIKGYTDTEVAAIKTETDKIAGAITKIDTIDGIVDDIKAAVVTEVADILEDTGTTLPSTLSALDTLIDGAITKIDTIDGIIDELKANTFVQDKVYPTLADGIVVTADSTAWTLGAFVEVIPASTITSAFTITGVNIEVQAAADTYELVLYSGAESSEVEIGRTKFTSIYGDSLIPSKLIKTPKLAANTRISAKLATKGGGGDTLRISVQYNIVA